MKYLVTGAGQIGSQLIEDLKAAGHTVNVLRASKTAIAGVTLFSGDVANRDLVAEASKDCAAIFHCTHAPYDSREWAKRLPHAELTVLNRASELGIPAIFPESVYAFAGHREIREGAGFAPIDRKGEVRVQLLEQREAHDARAISIVSADLYGPTATAAGSVLKATVLDPLENRRPIIVMADPDAKHSFTYIPDLTRAMLSVAESVEKQGILHAPTEPAVPLRRWAQGKRVWSVPSGVLKVAGAVNRTMFELSEISPLWYRDSVLLPGQMGVPSLEHGD